VCIRCRRELEIIERAVAVPFVCEKKDNRTMKTKEGRRVRTLWWGRRRRRQRRERRVELASERVQENGGTVMTRRSVWTHSKEERKHTR